MYNVLLPLREVSPCFIVVHVHMFGKSHAAEAQFENCLTVMLDCISNGSPSNIGQKPA